MWLPLRCGVLMIIVTLPNGQSQGGQNLPVTRPKTKKAARRLLFYKEAET
jgi:hypothetical protein